MSDKGILGGKIVDVIDIHQEALHLTLHPVVMLVVFLMQGHEKLSVIEHTRSLPRPWRNGAFCGFSTCTASIASQRINTRSSLNTFNMLRETLTIDIVKINCLLGRLWLYGFDGHINLWQEYEMVACRGLIVNCGVKLDQTHNPRSIEFQSKDV